MRKRGLAILVMAAVLAIGAGTISAYAGWEQSGSNWVYKDSYGSNTTNEWKKGADDQWRYLNSSGVMATNSWVEDTYYVDANGLLLSDKWAKLEDPHWDKYDSSEQYKWYYFGSSGKLITETWKKIDNKWYYFDSDGAMLTGWVLDDMYYTGTDGVMKTGWQKLVPPKDDSYDDDRVSPGDDADGDGMSWYYFATSGKKYVPDLNGAEYGERKVDGAYYCFDEYGAMQTGWRNIKSDTDSGIITDYKYFNSDGKARVGWLSLEPPEDIASSYSGDVEWFYFNTNGYPKAGKKEGEGSTSDLVKINGNTYMFNELGNPVYGLQKVYTGNSSDSYTAYYFGDKATSSVVKGKKKIEEGDGSETEFYFAETGRGYTGVKDSYLYYMGKIQKAESGTKYQVITVNGTNYVVNTSGKVAKSTKVKDADGVEYKTGGSGNLIQIDGENPGKDKYNDPVEPIWYD